MEFLSMMEKNEHFFKQGFSVLLCWLSPLIKKKIESFCFGTKVTLQASEFPLLIGWPEV